MLRVVETEEEVKSASRNALDELARRGAQEMLKGAMEAEVAEYLELYRDLRDAEGRAMVVRNGTARSPTARPAPGT